MEHILSVKNYIYYNPKVDLNIYVGEDIYTKQKVLIKKIIKKDIHIISYLKLIRELELLKSFRHKNFIIITELIDMDKNLFIIQEYNNAGTMYSLLKDNVAYPEIQVKYYIKQIKDAMIYLVSNNINHNNIHPSNIYFSSKKFHKDYECNVMLGIIKIDTDFIDKNEYMCPDVIMNNKYNSKSDLWSIGMIMFKLLFGHQDINNLYELSMKDNNLSLDCIDLLNKLLETADLDRINWNDFFIHPWFQDEVIEEDKNINIIDNYYPLSNDTDINMIKPIPSTAIEIPIRNLRKAYNVIQESIYKFATGSY